MSVGRFGLKQLTPYHMLMPERLPLLPSESKKIAQSYADALRTPGLRKPLSVFLRGMSQVENIQGVGMAVWQEKQIGPTLSVYAFIDFSDFSYNPSRSKVSCQQVGDIFAPFYQSVYEVSATLSSGLEYVNTSGASLDQLAAQFQSSLRAAGEPNHVVLAMVGTSS